MLKLICLISHELRELKSDGIFYRKDYKTNPSKVEYGFTKLGLKLKIVLDDLVKFHELYKPQFICLFYKRCKLILLF